MLLPVADALTDGLMFGSVIVVMAVMLTRANTRQERLVARSGGRRPRVDALTGLATRRAFDGALETALSPARSPAARRWCSSTSTRSSRSTTPTGTRWATTSWCTWPTRAARAGSAPRTPSCRGSAVTSSPSCCPAARRTVAIRRARGPARRRSASTPLALADGTLLALSISVGVAHVPQHSSRPARRSTTAADAALYEAKRAGRGPGVGRRELTGSARGCFGPARAAPLGWVSAWVRVAEWQTR